MYAIIAAHTITSANTIVKTAPPIEIAIIANDTNAKKMISKIVNNIIFYRLLSLIYVANIAKAKRT